MLPIDVRRPVYASLLISSVLLVKFEESLHLYQSLAKSPAWRPSRFRVPGRFAIFALFDLDRSPPLQSFSMPSIQPSILPGTARTP